MIAQIRSFAAFRVLREIDVVSSSLCLDSVEDDSGSVTFLGSAVSRSDAGNWLVIGRDVYLIDKITPEAEQSSMSVVSPIQAFSRGLLYAPPAPGTTVGAFIRAAINTNWVTQDDGIYAIPYLSVSNSDTGTAFVPPDTDDSGIYVLSDYIRLMRRMYDVKISFEARRDGINATIAVEARGSAYIVFGDGHSALESAAYSRSGVAKITTVHPVAVITGYDENEKPVYELDEAGEKVYDLVVEDWYLSADGAVSREVPEKRAEGEWITMTVAEKNDPYEKAAEKFAKNASSHKVEFWSDRELSVMDRCTIRLYGELLSGSISYKGRRSSDARYYYKSGELATTAAEKLKGAKSL